MDRKELGLRIRTIRLNKGLSQSQLAELMGYKDHSTLAKVETGINDITVETLYKYADVLNVRIGELLVANDKSSGYIKNIRDGLGSQKIILNCAGGIVEKNGKILFQRRTDNNKWGLVGGLLELNETYIEAAIREIKEETGLNVRPKYLLGIFHNHNMVWGNGDKAHTIGAYYVFEIVGGDLRVDEESFELKFCSQDETPPLFAPDHQKAVDAYYKGIKHPLLNENSMII